MSYLTNRLREPSTWAGLASLIPMAMQATAGPLSPHMIGGLVAAVAAIFMREQSSNAV